MSRTALFATVLFLCLALATTGCVPPAPPQCPQPPAQSKPLPPQMPRAGTSSVEIEFSGNYIKQMVLSKIPPAAPNDNVGIEIRQVKLEEKFLGNARTNLMALQFAVWGKGSNGDHVFVPGREYTLRLRLTPYLVTERIVPGEAQRRAFLAAPAGKPCKSGIVLAFDFYELAGGPNRTQTEAVDCRSKNYDLVDDQILRRGYDIVSKQDPMPVVLDELVTLLEGIVGSRTFLTGVDLSTDADLTLALTVDKGTPRPFRPTVARLRQIPGGADWGIWFDRDLVTPFIQQAVTDRVNAEAAKKSLTVLQDRTDVVFGASGVAIDVAGRVKVPLCGEVPLKIHVVAAPKVCNRTLGMCVTESSETLNPTSTAQKICVDGLTVLSDIASALKSVVNFIATLGQTSAQPAAANPCSAAKEIVVPAGSDILYGTAVDANGMFYIAGRSRSLDTILSRPEPVAASCPWN